MNALVVVAHDDDVILWMGGTIHHLNDWNWHVISMCNDMNNLRKLFFIETCKKLNAKADALNYLDYQNDSKLIRKNSIYEMKQSLIKTVEETKYDYIFTHSRDQDGEYSYHANHHEVYKAVESLASEGWMVENKSKIVYFCYYPIYGLSGLGTVARKDAQYYFQLNYGDLAFKVELIRNHTLEYIKNLENDLGSPCPNPEAFEGDNLNLPYPFIKRNK